MKPEQGILERDLQKCLSRLKEFEQYVLVTGLTSVATQVMASSLKEAYREALELRRKLGRPLTPKDLEDWESSHVGTERQLVMLEGIIESHQEEVVLEHAFSAFESYLAAPETYQYFWRAQALVFLVSIAEDMLLEIARDVLTSNPVLLGPEATGSLQVAKNNHLRSSKLEELITAKLREWGHNPVREVCKFLSSQWQVGIPARDFEEICEMVERRHLLVHSGGLFTQLYMDRTNKRLRPKGAKVGEPVQIDEQYLSNAILKVAVLGTMLLNAYTKVLVSEIRSRVS